MRKKEQKRRNAFDQAQASFALDGLTAPKKTEAMREQWLSCRITTADFFARLKAHYTEAEQ